MRGESELGVLMRYIYDARDASERQYWMNYYNATLAQLAERVLGKDEVIGSNPMGSSKFATVAQRRQQQFCKLPYKHREFESPR